MSQHDTMASFQLRAQGPAGISSCIDQLSYQPKLAHTAGLHAMGQVMCPIRNTI